MSRSSSVAWCVWALMISTCGVAAARSAKPSIADVEVRTEPERVLVSYRLVDCLPEETLERIESGIPIRFKHKIEIVDRRPGLFSRDRVYSRTLLETGVQYDSLTERYELTRLTAMKSRRKQPELDPLDETTQSKSSDEMRDWLIEVRDAPLFVPDAGKQIDYRVRIEVAIGRKWFLLIIPTSQTVELESPTELGD